MRRYHLSPDDRRAGAQTSTRYYIQISTQRAGAHFQSRRLGPLAGGLDADLHRLCCPLVTRCAAQMWPDLRLVGVRDSPRASPYRRHATPASDTEDQTSTPKMLSRPVCPSYHTPGHQHKLLRGRWLRQPHGKGCAPRKPLPAWLPSARQGGAHVTPSLSRLGQGVPYTITTCPEWLNRPHTHVLKTEE